MFLAKLALVALLASAAAAGVAPADRYHPAGVAPADRYHPAGVALADRYHPAGVAPADRYHPAGVAPADRYHPASVAPADRYHPAGVAPADRYHPAGVAPADRYHPAGVAPADRYHPAGVAPADRYHPAGVAPADRYHPAGVAPADRYHPAGAPPPAPPQRTAAAGAESSAQHWRDEAQAAIRARLARPAGARARNVVMFLGDGMSVPTLAAARTLLGQRRGASGEEAKMHFETFPTSGLVKTYCVNAQVADSACSATAYLCGAKANQGTLGLSAAVPRWDCAASTDPAHHLQSIAEWALADGRDAGVVTTTRITHASPGAVYAKAANRHWENDAAVRQDGGDAARCPDIAHQLVHMHPGNKFKVILGGGRREFINTTNIDEEGSRGRRTDGRNLIEEWLSDKSSRNLDHRYIWNRQQLGELMLSPPDYLLGLFENNHLQYHKQANLETEPTLTELTEVAIRSLSRNEKGFFLFVEGGRIDHAHHDNLVELALDETLEMDAAVARAAEMLAEDDSLIVVTADHAHVMAFNGYSQRGNDILGPSRDTDENNVPYMTLSYTNGPGFRSHVNGIRPNVTAESNFRALNWESHVDVPLGSETHGGDDVAVFARGPHHSMFTGLYEQSQLPHLMAYAACIGPGEHACSSAINTSPFILLLASTALFNLIALRQH